MSMVDKARNALKRFTGRSRRTAGRVSGDREMEARGAAEKIGGDVKQAGENLKSTRR
ncbi:CsbD family protein [Parafrankia sp. FMc2]|uniref:CsbD family protein n=1 Tax=Parafrankia sp. FMc2 TaxID=3233196 RepID=UPI0034D42B22